MPPVASTPPAAPALSASPLLAASPDVVWGLDAGGRIRMVNRETILAPERAFAQAGRHAHECIPESAIASWELALSRARAGDPEAEALLADDDRCWAARIRATPTSSDGVAYVASIRDISAAYASAQEAEAAAFRYEVLAEVTGSVIYERSLDEERGVVSPSIQSVFGYDPELARLAGISWWLDRVHEDDQAIVRSRFAKHQPGHTTRWSVEYRVQRHDGTWAIVQDQGRTIEATELAPARAVGIITDITKMRALQAQLQHAQRLEMVGRLAAGVAHDFNNVLSAIGGFTSVLLDSTDPDDPRRADLLQVEGLVERAAGLTSNLLGLTRQRERGRTRLVNVADELRRLAPTLRILIGTTLELAVDTEDLDVSVAIDPGLLDQVILNLAANARDATPDGGRVSIGVREAGPDESPRVQIWVRDNGSGIPAEVLKRVFEPFFTTKSERQGTGLGLWLVREIIEGAGGSVSVDSSPHQGTIVTLDLPATDEPPSGDPNAKRRAIPAPTGERTALLIDDEDPVRYVTRRILERSGYRVLEASAGGDGIRLLEENRQRIDVVITDLHMPGLAGPPLIERLRDTAPEIGCLVVSGLADRFAPPDLDRERLDVLAKPWDTGALIGRVNSLAAGTTARRSRSN